MTSPRVLHYAPSLDSSGGLRSYVLGLASAQVDRGVESVIGAPRPRPGDPALAASLAEAIRRVDPHVVHLHGGYVLPEDEWPDLPVVSTMHGHGLYCPTGRKWSASLGDCTVTPGVFVCSATMLRHQCGSRRPTNIVASQRRFHARRRQQEDAHQHCVSEYVAARIRESGYQPGGGMSVVYAPILAPTPVEPAPDAPEVLFAGRLWPNKGADVLLRAAARCRTQPRVAIAGEGPERVALQRLVDELGIANRTTFLGWRPAEEIAALHGPRTVLAVPSQWPDPAPMVAMEVAARGRACLVSDRGGLPELVPHADQVVPAADVAAWAARIDTVLEDEHWLDTRGRAALDLWRERFDPDVVVPAFSTIYEQVAD